MAVTVVPVSLGALTYDIVVDRGLLDDLDHLLARYCPARHYAVISDATVGSRYGNRVRDLVGANSSLHTFTDGERSKTRETWALLTDQMLQSKVNRDDAVIALGGGVVGDVAGFVAATYMRGLPLVHVPTSLVAMIDSSIGGKTGVDTAAGKNLVGAFHQPRAVLVDLDTLSTLPQEHLAAGTAEAIKHGAVSDDAYFNRLVSHHKDILAKDTQVLHDVVTTSARIKSAVVREDEQDRGRRAILNFGHTVAHAFETATNFTGLHGHAVALGMLAETRLGTRLGITEPGTAESLQHAVQSFGLPHRVTTPVHAGTLLELMYRDKKNRGEAVMFALLRRVGEAAQDTDGSWTFEAPEDLIKRVWMELQ